MEDLFIPLPWFFRQHTHFSIVRSLKKREPLSLRACRTLPLILLLSMVFVRTFTNNCPLEACSQNRPFFGTLSTAFPHPYHWPLSSYSSSFYHSVCPPFYIHDPPFSAHCPVILHSPDQFTALPVQVLGSEYALLEPYPPAWPWTSPCIHPFVGT